MIKKQKIESIKRSYDMEDKDGINVERKFSESD